MKYMMMTIFTAITLTASGQTNNDTTINLVNVKTEKHIHIPGTRLYIIPPNGFKIASNFVGLQKDNNTVLQVYDLAGGSFYSNAATFSREKFEKSGAKVFEYKELKINEFPAKYVLMQGDQSVKAYSLVFGDSTFSVMIMGVFSANEEETGKQIKEAMLSIIYDKNLKIDPFESASFKLDESASKFKFFKSSANMFIYSIGGIENNSSEPTVMVSSIPADATVTPTSISEILIEGFEKNNLTDKKIKNKSTDKINGYSAFEAEIYGNMKGQKSLIYQLIIVNGDKAIAILGFATSDFDKNIAEFKKLARTIKLK